MSKCKHCSKEGTHFCRTVDRVLSPEKDAVDFVLSAVIAAATDSTLLGAVLGGDILGAVLGDALDGDLFD